jgi:hypothetical protein
VGATVGAASKGEASITKTDGTHGLLKWRKSIIVQYLPEHKLHVLRSGQVRKALTKKSRHEGRCKEALNLQREEARKLKEKNSRKFVTRLQPHEVLLMYLSQASGGW